MDSGTNKGGAGYKISGNGATEKRGELEKTRIDGGTGDGATREGRKGDFSGCKGRSGKASQISKTIGGKSRTGQ